MAATTQARSPLTVTFETMPLPLAASTNAYQGSMACIDTSAHVCTPGASANANLIRVGDFAQTVLNTLGSTVPVNVRFDTEKTFEWYNNDSGTPVTALFTNCYILDNQTVTGSASGNSVAGRVWQLDTVKGVLIEKSTQ